ncbi:DUF1488 family protein [Zobellella taiwanensis]|jgi:hypothetical protein|uniref:DUF1488 domain-containing protein n=1 Tax=Zobellella taiwanensis TaxID=347535 RepID=A0A2P7QX94_9GAMM|nr:DUF1488 domain-containing protein [Zobellella taiwanensis]PSJ42573.1 DUF1488 domain-containing protein [Zobellella taiwanensis]
MNQDVIVGEELCWQAAEQRVAFSAQWQGRHIPCFISLHRLEHMAAQPLQDEANILLAFESVRFDIEERVGMLIEEEAFAPDGGVYL